MTALPVTLVSVEGPADREAIGAARQLLSEYLTWVGELARSAYGLSFDVEAMIESDLGDASRFFPPRGRLVLVRQGALAIGIGALKELAPGVGEIQRMYLQPGARGTGAGRRLLEQLLNDARSLGHRAVRLESLRALSAAHGLYRSVGFVETSPYADNSMRSYQPAETLQAYRDSAVFMELVFDAAASRRPA